jgi:hypothetical protein
MQEAARRAELLRTSLGKVVSDLARRGLAVAPPLREIDGLKAFDPPKSAPKIAVRRVREELSRFP